MFRVAELKDLKSADEAANWAHRVLGAKNSLIAADADCMTQQSCLTCGRRPSDAHHLRFVQSHALSRKVSDEFTVPLCRGHHREVHRSADEGAWWERAGIDPTVTACALWLETHPLPTTPDQTRIEGCQQQRSEQQ
jgi:hypothetical protein